MKTIKLIGACVLGVTLSLTLTAHADYVSEVLADNPHIYYRFNETVNTDPAADAGLGDGAQDGDYHNFGGDSAVSVGAAGISGGGVGNTAASFPDNLNTAGPNSQVYRADAFVASAYTIELWAKPQTIRSQSLITLTNTAGPTAAFSHQINMTAGGTFENYLWDGAPKSVIGTTVAQTDAWYHVVATATNNGEMAIYVNGVKESTFSSIGTSWTGGTNWRIGAVSGKGTWYAGDLDELAIYSSVLSDDEIARHYINGSGALVVAQVADAAALDLTPSSNHKVLYAVDASPDNTTRTVNGIAFGSSDDDLNLAAGFSGNRVPGVTITSDRIAGNWFGANKPNLGTGADNDALEEILYDIRWGNGTPIEIDAAVEGGRRYELTLMFAENFHNAADARHFDIEVEGLLLLDEFDVFAEAGGLAKFVTVTYAFTAMDTNLDVNLLNGSTGDINPIINGFVLVEIAPTPAALPAGLAMLGLIAARRRRM